MCRIQTRRIRIMLLDPTRRIRIMHLPDPDPKDSNHAFAGSGPEGFESCWRIQTRRIRIMLPDPDPKDSNHVAGSGPKGFESYCRIRTRRIRIMLPDPDPKDLNHVAGSGPEGFESCCRIRTCFMYLYRDKLHSNVPQFFSKVHDSPDSALPKCKTNYNIGVQEFFNITKKLKPKLW